MRETIDSVPADQPSEKEGYANRKLIRPSLNRGDHNHGHTQQWGGGRYLDCFQFHSAGLQQPKLQQHVHPVSGQGHLYSDDRCRCDRAEEVLILCPFFLLPAAIQWEP